VSLNGSSVISKWSTPIPSLKCKWFKCYFKMVNADPEFEMLCEVDKWRFIAFIMLELQYQKPIPLDNMYLSRKGFDLKKRSMSLSFNRGCYGRKNTL
jgi:hypothetical protein